MNLRPLALLALLAPTLPAQDFRRELSPDRPDTTENPIPVEPGAFQVESTIWSFTKDRSDETWSLGEMNLKAGMTESTDIQLVLRPWIHQRTDGAAAEGFGDIDLRLKYNLWGLDGGKSAGALMPYLTIPTHTSVSTGEWEGGLIIPVAIDLTDRVGLSFQIDVSRGWDDDNREYGWNFLHSTSLGIGLTDRLGMFVEYIGVAGDSPYEATGSFGFTWNSTENLQWDISAGIGLNDAADDFSISQGITFRF